MHEAPEGKDTAVRPAFVPLGPLVEPSQRWIRVKSGKVVVADSRRTLLLREYGRGRLPTYFFPEEDVRMDLLKRLSPEPGADGMTHWTVQAGGLVAEDAARLYRDPPPERAALTGFVTFAWDKGLKWFEEEEEVFVHARDPHKRVDVLRSSRRVRVVVGGETVAETQRPALLFETNLPTRYYIPAEDVRMDCLEASTTTTRCPYKGQASYWSLKVGDTFKKDLVWTYREPIEAAGKIKGLLCFYNERVDLYVDGVLQERPQTPWSQE
jgi:uncharacterized protein (DUF427 family)